MLRKSPPRRWWLGLFAALAAPLLFGAGPEYAGCGSGPEVAPTGTPLPAGEVECAADGDCPSSCADVRCIAGECVEVGPMVDADGDGVAPPPCGGDCDDTRSDVAEGFPELCDGLDNNCNMLVDDGAPPTDSNFTLNFGDPTSVVLPFGDRFLVTTATRGAIFGVPVTIGGETATPIELLRLVSGAAFTRVRGAGADDGRVLLVAQVDDRALRYVVIRPDGDGLEVVAGPADLTHDLRDISALDIIAFDGEWAVGVDGERGISLGRERVVWTDLTAAPLVRISTMDALPSFAIATDGTHLVVPDTEDGLHFFLPTGAEVAGFTVPGISIARHPLASSRGRVVALLTDGIGFALRIAYVDVMGGPDETYDLPGSPTGEVSVHSTTGTVYVSWVGAVTTVTERLLPNLVTPAGAPLILEAPAGVGVDAVSVADGPRADAVGGGTTAGRASLTVVGACGR